MKTPAPLRLFDRLGVRLAVLLAIALFPLLVLAMIQSRSMQRESQARSEAALMGETLRAISAKTRIIQEAEAATHLLSELVVPVVNDPAACSRMMEQAQTTLETTSYIGYIANDGIQTCSSSGGIYDFSQNPRFQAVSQSDGVSYTVASHGQISGTAVLTISNPVHADGKRIGFIAISLPQHRFDTTGETLRVHRDEPQQPLTIMTFDRDGTILTSSHGMEDAEHQIPRDTTLEQFVGGPPVTFTAPSVKGEKRVYSIVDLVPGKLYALGSWPATTLLTGAQIERFYPVLFPALMWAASLFVAYFAMQKMVISYISRLARALHSFASGNRIVADLDFHGAPREFRDLAENYEKMTETILHDEAELEDTIHHKEVLLREVHHRVKNNLQLIASIINMQVRRARTPEAKAMLKGLQERVISLATVHRGLYMTSGLTDISANELLRDIVRQLVRATTGPDRHLTTEVEIDPVQLTPDQAVPLSLLLSEAVTNAIKYASADEGNPTLSVTLHKTEGSRVRLTIRNTIASSGPHSPGVEDRESGLGSQLVSAFVQQLGGTMTVTKGHMPTGESRPENIETDAGFHNLQVDFDIRPLNEAELRHQEANAT